MNKKIIQKSLTYGLFRSKIKALIKNAKSYLIGLLRTEIVNVVLLKITTGG